MKITKHQEENLAYIRQDAVKEMAGSSYTPAFCLSKLRESWGQVLDSLFFGQ